MKIKQLLIFISFFLLDFYVFANNSNGIYNDTIQRSIKIQSIDYLTNIARDNLSRDFDSVASVLIRAQKLSDSLGVINDKIEALILLGHLYFDNGYFENAESVFNDLLNNYYKNLSKEQLSDVKHTLGLNHIRFNNYDKAINLIQEALFYYEKVNDRAQIAKALKDIGAIYYYLGNENSALDNYQKALLIFREVNDSDGIARSYNNIGMIFKDKGNITLALEYLNKSLDIKKVQNNLYGIANTYGNIGDAYMTDNQLDKAIEYYNKALEMWIDLEYLHGITEVYNYLGEVYLKKGEYKKAIGNLEKGQKISLENKFKQRLIVNYQLLSDAFFEIQDYKNSILNLRQYNSLKDSLYESLTNQRIEEYKTKYENLKAENELFSQEKKIINQRHQFIIILIVLITVVVILILLIWQNRVIRQKSRKIQKINKELDERVSKRTSELRASQFSIDMAVDAILWMKKDGKFVYANNAACTMLGYTKEELMKMSVFEIVPEFTKDVWQEYWDHLKKKGSYVIQLYYKTCMGSEIPVETAFNFREFEGEEFNFTFSRNITERKLSEEKLKNAKEKAERSDKLKSAFLANMSHEIRTPMNAIIGFINLLGDRDITHEQKEEIIDMAQSSSMDLLNIVNDIIDISKIEADELAINKTLNYVNRQLSEIYKFYQKDINLTRNQDLEFKLQLESDSERIAVFTDQARFRQVMNNLVNNAIKFTEKGEVIIGYHRVTRGGRKLLKFYVKDTGIGIPEEKQKIIFDRFNQISEERKKLYKGTGLGLAISKKLVEILGGEIGVKSQEDNGSEFYFTLPYQVLDTPDFLVEKGKKEIERNWPGKVILIVEDTSSNYYLIENYLRPTKIQLCWAKSGKEALEMFQQNTNFDLVLMDIQLPGINGYEVTKLIKAHNKNIPVIAQTAYALAGERELSIKEGCDDYISKPIKRNTLIELLEKYLQ